MSRYPPEALREHARTQLMARDCPNRMTVHRNASFTTRERRHEPFLVLRYHFPLLRLGRYWVWTCWWCPDEERVPKEMER